MKTDHTREPGRWSLVKSGRNTAALQNLFLEGFHHDAPGTVHEAIGLDC